MRFEFVNSRQHMPLNDWSETTAVVAGKFLAGEYFTFAFLYDRDEVQPGFVPFEFCDLADKAFRRAEESLMSHSR